MQNMLEIDMKLGNVTKWLLGIMAPHGIREESASHHVWRSLQMKSFNTVRQHANYAFGVIIWGEETSS